MRKAVRALRVAVLTILVLASVAERARAESDDPDPSIRVPIPIEGAPVTGAEDAIVTIVEFSDFYCPYCRRSNDTLATLLRIYPGQVRIVYRHSLLDGTNATLAAETALAAEKRGRFWPMHDRLFAGPAPGSIDELVALAAEIGLDAAEIRQELTDHTHRPALAADMELAKTLGLRGVPAFFINGRPVFGAHSIGVFVRIIEEELAIGEKLVAGGVAPADVYATLLESESTSLAGAAELFRNGVDPDAIVDVDLGREANRRGGREPLVTIVEFSDFTCGYCRRLHPNLAAMSKRYGDDLRVVYRHFPLGGVLKPVAQAAEEAGAQGKFWQFTDSVFAEDAAPHATRAELVAHAKIAGLDLDAFNRALDEQTHARTVARDAATASALGVTGTPTLFVNGRPLVGAPPTDVLIAAIEAEMKAARAMLDDGVERRELYKHLVDR